MVEGKKTMLKAMGDVGPRVVSAKRMEAFLYHYFMSNNVVTDEEPSYHVDIQFMLDKHEGVVGDIPPT